MKIKVGVLVLCVIGISIAIPGDVSLFPPSNITKYSMQISWSQYTSGDFQSYRLYRSLSASVDSMDSLLAEITTASTTTFLDTMLHAGSKYFYKIFVVDTLDSLSNGSNEVTARTIPNAYPFSDTIYVGDPDFAEAPDASWGISSDDYHSPPVSYTDSPGTQYPGNTDNSLYLVVDMAGANMPMLSFWERHSTENNNDFCYVEVSDNYGSNWTRIFSANGSSDWRHIKMDLTPWAGSVLMIRFRLKADGDGYVGGGWWIDDVSVGETDIPTLSYPFFDDVEDSTVRSYWLSSSWQPTATGINGSLAWNSRPEGNLGYSGNYSLTLGNTLSLSTSTNPQLQFYMALSYPSIYVQVSTDNGITWTSLSNWSYYDPNFNRFQIDLSSYAGQDMRLRFLQTGGGGAWTYLENILIKDAPADVTLEPASNITPNTAVITWHPYSGTDFKMYELRRSTSPGVGWSTTLVRQLNIATDTIVIDSSLQANTTYYYRVFVVDTTDMKSVGSNEINFTTPFVTYNLYPFSDDIEGDTSRWVWDSPWGVTTDFYHSGSRSWNESPGTNYTPNLDRSLYLGLNLAPSSMPVLYFWTMTAIPDNGDHGYVEISADGGNSWTRVFSITGNNVWQRVSIDFTPWRTAGNVIIRFRFVSDNDGTVGNGWFIDDVEVKETEVIGPITLPFYDTVDDSLTRSIWLTSTFRAQTVGLNNTLGWNSNPWDLGWSGSYALTSGNTFDLTGTTAPQLQFYMSLNYPSIYVQVSTDNGITWSTRANWNYSDVTLKRFQVDLSSYAGQSVRLRFLKTAGSGNWLHLDNILVKDAPSDVVLEPPSNITSRSARLTWHPYQGNDFSFYELRRSTSPGVDWSSTLIATLTSQTDTSFVDSSLNANTTYYYRVFVVDTFDMKSLGSTEINFTTLWVSYASYPLSYDVETTPGPEWAWDTPWDIVTGFAHSGNHSWSESPNGYYSPNTSTALNLGIDLSSADMPVLTFWQYIHIPDWEDRGWVRVNTGSGWTYIYSVTGSKGWHKVRIDLSEFAGAGQVVIQFRFTSDGDNTTGNGWFIDDIQVSETTIPEIPYPFYDNVEDTFVTRKWIPGMWYTVAGGGVNNSKAWYKYSSRTTGSYGLTLGNNINLTNTQHPRLVFQYKAGSYSTLACQISLNNGHAWSEIWSGNAGSYTTTSVDLSPYVGQSIRIRFHLRDWDDYAWIDNIRVEEDLSQYTVADTVRLLSPDSVVISVGMNTPKIYAIVYEPGITDTVGQGQGVFAQIGYGSLGVVPWDSTWVWSNATYDGDQDSIYDRYWGNVSPSSIGEYNFAFRFSVDSGQTWIYADLDGTDLGAGGFNSYTPDQAGYLLVTLQPDIVLSEDTINLSVRSGDSQTHYLNVSNIGAGPLYMHMFESPDGATYGDVYWLTVTPFSGYLDPNDSLQINITVITDTLTIGNTYTGYVLIESNDPDESQYPILINLTVLDSTTNVITGVLVDPYGNPIGTQGVVQVYVGDSLVTSVSTDGIGQFQIVNLPIGSYDLRGYANGFFPAWTHGITENAQAVQITLSPVPSPIPTNLKVDFWGNYIRINGQIVPKGSVVLAYDPDGVLCGVYYVSIKGRYGLMHVYGDDPYTPEDEGAEPGDTLLFVLNEYPVFNTRPNPTVWTTNNDVIKVNFDVVDHDSLYLRQGWNLISFTLFPPDTLIDSILNSIMSNVILVTSFDQDWGGARTYDPSLPPYYSDLNSMDPYHGYWVKLSQADTLVITGERLHSSYPLPLNAGWNLTSYLPEPAESTEIAFTSILGNIVVASGFDSVAMTYVPGSPYSDLLVLRNGLGYWVKTFVEDTLVYSDAYIRGTAKTTTTSASQLNLNKRQMIPTTMSRDGGVIPTPYWSDYYGEAYFNSDPVNIGDTITVYDPDGVLCGLFVVTTSGHYGFLHVYGDDPTTPDVDEGAQYGDSLRFFINGVYAGTATGENAWTGTREPIEFSLNAVDVSENESRLPRIFALYPVRPNPLHSDVDIRFAVPKSEKVAIGLFDATGRLVNDLLNKTFKPGYYSIKLEVKELPTGVYFLRMKAGNFVKIRKLALVK